MIPIALVTVYIVGALVAWIPITRAVFRYFNVDDSDEPMERVMIALFATVTTVIWPAVTVAAIGARLATDQVKD